MVKFLYVFYLASKLKEKMSMAGVVGTGLVTLGIVGSMVYQKDLGGALIFFVVYVIALYCASGRFFMLVGGFGLLIGAAFAAFKLFYHVRVRMQTWLDPWQDPAGGGYQVLQSVFAIASWGFLGRGLGRGIPQKIPVVERDFIFSAICEEFGSFFGICIIVLFITFFYIGIKTALRGRKDFNVNLALGFTVLISFQFFLIIGGVIKLIPLTGVTMPFISYGGTSVVVSLLIAGILQWLNGEAGKEELEEAARLQEEERLLEQYDDLSEDEKHEIDVMLSRRAGDSDEIEEIY